MNDARDDIATLRERRAQWERFAAWEAREEARRVRSLAADLEWLEDALALTRRFDPDWGSLERVREKADRLARDRAALAVLGSRHE